MSQKFTVSKFELVVKEKMSWKTNAVCSVGTGYLGNVSASWALSSEVCFVYLTGHNVVHDVVLRSVSIK